MKSDWHYNYIDPTQDLIMQLQADSHSVVLLECQLFLNQLSKATRNLLTKKQSIILVFGSNDQQPLCSKAIQCGADDYFILPLSIKELEHRVDMQLKFRNAQIGCFRAGTKSSLNKKIAQELFLTMLSHELRSPLTSILTWAQLLKNPSMSSDKLAIGLESIEESAMTQNKIINELLDLSGIIFDKIAFDLRPIAFNEMIDKTLQSLQDEIKAKDVTIRVIHTTPLIILADELRLQQVVTGLVLNAIKQTSYDKEIKLFLHASSEHGRQVAQLLISDETSYCKAYVNNKLGQNYMHFHPKDGFGKGMAMINCLIKLHGGTFKTITNTRNLKLFFILNFPLHQAD